MKQLQALFERVDTQLTDWMAVHGITLLRISVGIIFFWFGALKLFPNLSPAEGLAAETIQVLTFGIVTPNISLPVLAVWEVLIGIGLLTGRYMRITLLLLFVQMMGTVTPLVLFPDATFTIFPIGLTLEGQYIIKNLVLISAGIVIGATVRGGDIVTDPEIVVQSRQKTGEKLQLQKDVQ